MSIPTYIYTRGVCAIKVDKPMITRERIMAVIYNPETNLHLIVQYVSNDEISFVAGGIEIGHTHAETIIKEIQEETGITKIDSIIYMPHRNFDVQFYSPHRDQNYHNVTHVYLVHTTQQTLSISPEEQKIQSPHRWSMEQIQQAITTGRNNTNYEATQYIVDHINNKSL